MIEVELNDVFDYEGQDELVEKIVDFLRDCEVITQAQVVREMTNDKQEF